MNNQNHINENKSPDWMKDPAVKQISKEKLDFLEDCFSAIQGKDKKSLMPLLGLKIREAKKAGLQFTPEELNIAVTAIKKQGDTESNRQIDAILKKGQSNI
ncbi:MAG: hypothetical protein IKL04_03160 [Lachnospiraceae bacterium]|nr:hypothetical protein [Lachnospiraceae bacterium]